MRHFQTSKTTMERPPALCSQKIQRPSGLPARKLASPEINSSRSRKKRVRFVARAFMESPAAWGSGAGGSPPAYTRAGRDRREIATLRTMQQNEAAALVAERRARAAERWNLDRGVVLVPAGLLLPIAGTDQFHEYHAHPEHQYLAGVGQPGGVLAFDAGEGWTLFVPQPDAAERVWTGDGP
ncbi:MAG: hypothetical protein F4Z48_08130, partial [Dehalococcoidia bacterium]|nr:hypothetical protein [Dehalococcoidia bacterium]